jgi:tripartite-type tricarboxylate transporter receptor subunit TctC
MHRRHFLRAGLPLATLPTLSILPRQAWAAWPERPVRIVVPTQPGSPGDVAARAISDVVGARLGQPLVIENRGGAMGVIGMSAVAKAAPDGYTFGITNLQLAAVPALQKNMPFDMDKDLQSVVQLTVEGPVLVVRADLPVQNMAQLVDHLRKQGDNLTYASSGGATPAHLGMELLLRQIGARARHVPYQGAAPAVTGLAAGQVDMALLGSAAVLPMVNGGRVRAIAVSAAQRNAGLPQVPTFEESGFGAIDVQGWVGLVAPAGTPAAMVQRMNEIVNEALKAPAVQQRFASTGALPQGGSVAEFTAFIRRESTRWQQVIREAGIQVG